MGLTASSRHQRRIPSPTPSIAWFVGPLAQRDAALAPLGDDGPAEPRDELGIGPLRDALANASFRRHDAADPGEYFVLVPAMYARLESDAPLRRAPQEAIAGP